MTHSFTLDASGSHCQQMDYFSAESLATDCVAFDHSLTPAALTQHLNHHNNHNNDSESEWHAFTNSLLNSDLVPDSEFVPFSDPFLKYEQADGTNDAGNGSESKREVVQSNPLLDQMLALPLNGIKSEPGAKHDVVATHTNAAGGAAGGSDKQDSDDEGGESGDESDELSDSCDESDESSVESNEQESESEGTVVEKDDNDEQPETVFPKMESEDTHSGVNEAGVCLNGNSATCCDSSKVKRENCHGEESEAKGNGVNKKQTKVKKSSEKKKKADKSTPKEKKEKSARGKKRKSNLQRRNIKKVMSEDKLSEEVLAARREEHERLERQKHALIEFKNTHFTASTSASFKSERPYQPQHQQSKWIDEICLSSDDEADHLPAARKEMIELLSDEEDMRNKFTDTGDNPDADDFDANNCGIHTDDTLNQPDASGKILINVGHAPDEADVFLSQRLSKVVKPHQIGGIRFMYANVIESAAAFSSSAGIGCILAHAMGLGKTLQIISFIDVLFKSTTAKHVLCVVPINTLQNWVAEFDHWIPQQPTIEQSFKKEEKEQEYRKFKLYVVNADHKNFKARSDEILSWKNNSGVLLMGYEMYRIIVMDLAKSRKCDSLKKDEFDSLHSSLMEGLVDPGPDVVICDEGHRIKNAKSGISHALKKVKTKRRIVLTGYPLQNNLMEYWCMVDFVRPNYLGSEKEFGNMFEKPIKNGTFVDSTPADKKLMRRRSHILYKMLTGFVQRRSHVILKNTLPQKYEHVFLTRLTSIQKKLLVALFAYLKENSQTGEFRINPILLFSVCNKIWNHPDIMFTIVNENGSLELDDDVDHVPSSSRKKKAVKSKSSAASAFSAVTAATAASDFLPQFDLFMQSPSTSSQHFPATTPQSSSKDRAMDFSWAQPCFRGYVPNMMSTSTKMVLLFELMDKIIAMNDKLLVFSQSLLTLNIIEKFMSDRQVPGTTENWSRSFNYYRLDGSTPTPDRERYINNFNRDPNFKVFLLSTKAGSLGINLIGACRIIIFDASWNPCHDAQAACRIFRYGQLKNCFIYRFVADNSLEKKIYDRQINKQGMSHRVVDELNPESKFSYSHICSLIEGLDKFSEPPILPFPDSEMNSMTDPLVEDMCRNFRELLTDKPFEHESLLLDDKESRLTEAEKQLAEVEFQKAKRGNGPDLSYRAGPSHHNIPFPNGSGSTPSTITYPWQSTYPTSSNPSGGHFSGDQFNPYMQYPPNQTIMKSEYPNMPAIANGSLPGPRCPLPPYSQFQETQSKLMSRGFSSVSRYPLTRDLILNDKTTGRPSTIRTGELVNILQNPQTGERVLMTHDCKIVSISPLPHPVSTLPRGKERCSNSYFQNGAPPRTPVATASSGPPVVVTLSDDENED